MGVRDFNMDASTLSHNHLPSSIQRKLYPEEQEHGFSESTLPRLFQNLTESVIE